MPAETRGRVHNDQRCTESVHTLRITVPFFTVWRWANSLSGYSKRHGDFSIVPRYPSGNSIKSASRDTLARQPTLESLRTTAAAAKEYSTSGTEYTPRTPHNVFYAPPPPHSTSRTSLFSHFCWCPITDADPLESLVRRVPLSRSPDEGELGSAPNQAR